MRVPSKNLEIKDVISTFYFLFLMFKFMLRYAKLFSSSYYSNSENKFLRFINFGVSPQTIQAERDQKHNT